MWRKTNTETERRRSSHQADGEGVNTRDRERGWRKRWPKMKPAPNRAGRNREEKPCYGLRDTARSNKTSGHDKRAMGSKGWGKE